MARAPGPGCQDGRDASAAHREVGRDAPTGQGAIALGRQRSAARRRTTAPTNVIFGAGAIGGTIAQQLANSGATVRVVTRSGQELGIPRVTSVVGDASQPDTVRALTAGARTVYFTAQPPYPDWPEGFPPLIEGLIAGLRGSGVHLAVADNLYGYGDTHGAPIREDLPLTATTRKGAVRAWVAERLMEAHAAGDVAVTIARGSDYFGPDGFDSLLGDRFFGPILAGRKVRLLGDPDAPHTVTYIADFARALIELSARDEAYGHAWHVPSAPAVSFRRLAELAAEVSGSPPVLVSRVSRTGLRLVGMFSPPVREMVEMLYEFEQPFVVDDTRIREAFGLAETPLEHALRLTAEWWRGELAAAATASKQPR